ncbi:MAG: hypothetical protein IJL89_08535, partial [Firmicutes bacterium]|nr:hypothetical protein [Bacillota bacterium]
MRSIKKAAAVVFTVMAAVLMQTAAFAYTGSGTKTDPYTVYTFDELKELCEGGAYVKLGADINESTFKDIAIKQNTYLDLAGHSLNITNTNSFSTLFFVVDSGCLEISD